MTEYTGQVVGLDVGDSSGQAVPCLQFLRRAERRLKQQQRRLSRKLGPRPAGVNRKGVKPQYSNYHK
ncbi:transposase [Thermostichus sp. OS-CIW-31]|uniref:hypothetical protein n=1 Tax=Synechococcus sp. R5-16 TaxID=2291955 RepID=UPI0039C16C7B